MKNFSFIIYWRQAWRGTHALGRLSGPPRPPALCADAGWLQNRRRTGARRSMSARQPGKPACLYVFCTNHLSPPPTVTALRSGGVGTAQTFRGGAEANVYASTPVAPDTPITKRRERMTKRDLPGLHRPHSRNVARKDEALKAAPRVSHAKQLSRIRTLRE
jgi:hypothetical protein